MTTDYPHYPLSHLTWSFVGQQTGRVFSGVCVSASLLRVRVSSGLCASDRFSGSLLPVQKKKSHFTAVFGSLFLILDSVSCDFIPKNYRLLS